MMLNFERIDLSGDIYFIISNFYYFISYLNVNHVTIYAPKSRGEMALKFY